MWSPYLWKLKRKKKYFTKDPFVIVSLTERPCPFPLLFSLWFHIFLFWYFKKGLSTSFFWGGGTFFISFSCLLQVIGICFPFSVYLGNFEIKLSAAACIRSFKASGRICHPDTELSSKSLSPFRWQPWDFRILFVNFGFLLKCWEIDMSIPLCLYPFLLRSLIFPAGRTIISLIDPLGRLVHKKSPDQTVHLFWALLC